MQLLFQKHTSRFLALIYPALNSRGVCNKHRVIKITISAEKSMNLQIVTALFTVNKSKKWNKKSFFCVCVRFPSTGGQQRYKEKLTECMPNDLCARVCVCVCVCVCVWSTCCCVCLQLCSISSRTHSFWRRVCSWRRCCSFWVHSCRLEAQSSRWHQRSCSEDKAGIWCWIQAASALQTNWPCLCI